MINFNGIYFAINLSGELNFVSYRWDVTFYIELNHRFAQNRITAKRNNIQNLSWYSENWTNYNPIILHFKKSFLAGIRFSLSVRPRHKITHAGSKQTLFVAKFTLHLVRHLMTSQDLFIVSSLWHEWRVVYSEYRAEGCSWTLPPAGWHPASWPDEAHSLTILYQRVSPTNWRPATYTYLSVRTGLNCLKIGYSGGLLRKFGFHTRCWISRLDEWVLASQMDIAACNPTQSAQTPSLRLP